MLLHWTPLTPPNVITTLPVHYLGISWTWLSLLNYITKDMWRFHSLSAEDGDIFIFEMGSFSQSFLLLLLAPWRQHRRSCNLHKVQILNAQKSGFMESSVQFEVDEQRLVMKKWMHSKRRTNWKKVNGCKRVVTLNEWEQLVSGDSVTWPPWRRMVAK